MNLEQEKKKRPIRILLVEDFPAVREIVRDLLTRDADLEVVGEAEDGLESVEMTRALHPDVVLMDVILPTLNGIHATEMILKEMPEVRVIAYSGHTGWPYVQKMLEVGARGYVAKADAYSDLIIAIRAAMSGRVFISSSAQKPGLPELKTTDAGRNYMGITIHGSDDSRLEGSGIRQSCAREPLNREPGKRTEIGTDRI